MPAAPPVERYCRANDVVRREVGATTFLIHTDRNAIHKLNATGAVVWEHLAEPSSTLEILDTLAASFPAARRKTIEKDLAALLDELVCMGLATRCG